MKISELTVDTALKYARAEGDDPEAAQIMFDAAKSYVLHYTGLSAEAADELDDLALAVLIIFTDMYDNRTMTAENAAENKTAKTLLGMHCLNLVGGGDE
jgi:hypothetical protein